MAGLATDYTKIGLLWTNIGRRTAIWLPLVTVPQILIFAMLLNKFASQGSSHLLLACPSN